MWEASSFLRANLSWLLPKILISFKTGLHLYCLQWRAKLEPVPFCNDLKCSQALKFTQRPVWPMYNIPQVSGIAYTTPTTQFTKICPCFASHWGFFFLSMRVHKPPSFLGAEKPRTHHTWKQLFSGYAQRSVYRAPPVVLSALDQSACCFFLSFFIAKIQIQPTKHIWESQRFLVYQSGR